MIGLYYVKWMDSRGVSASWVFVDQVEHEACILHTVGAILKETEDVITIVPHFELKDGKIDQLCGEMTIPKVAIIKTEKIGEIKE